MKCKQSARTLANEGQPLALDFVVWFDHIAFAVGDLPRAAMQVDEPIDLKAKLAELEHDLIVAALDQTDWVTAHAANWLKLQRTTLVEKMRKHGIKQEH